jgi:asparagine synthase (glutamine-hydrolysing)
LIKRGRLVAFYKEVGRRCRESGSWASTLKAILGNVIPSLLPVPVRNRCLSLWQGDGREPWKEYSLINGQFAREVSLWKHMNRQGHDPYFRFFPDTRQARLSLMGPGASGFGALWYELGCAFNIEVRDPTFDKRVIEFCFSIPDDQHFRSGKGRLLIRRAAEGLLPDRVLCNTRRGLQAADLAQRLAAAPGELVEILERIEGASLPGDYLDLDRVREACRSFGGRMTGDLNKLGAGRLMRALMAGLFLSNFDRENK